MGFARVLTVASACVALGAAAAACSGSFGSGTNGPVPLASLGAGMPSPSSSPASSSVIVTYGESTAFQSLPDVAGYSGAIAFPKAPPPTPNPKSTALPTPESMAIGATLSVVKPDDGPDLNFVSGKGKRKRTRELPARAIAYVKLLPTHDAVLSAYPRIELDIPRELASQYRDGEFGLALWNAGEKDARYRLAVAARDEASPPPLTRTAAPATAAPLASASPAVSASPGARTGLAVQTAPPALPAQRLLFVATEKPLKLVANQPAVFALYALPRVASPTPVASPSPAAPSTSTPSASSPQPKSS